MMRSYQRIAQDEWPRQGYALSRDASAPSAGASSGLLVFFDALASHVNSTPTRDPTALIFGD
jgi:hypothetical protein